MESVRICIFTDSIYCCGAGTAADTQFITETVGSSLSLYEFNMQRKPRVDMAVRLFKQRLFRYQGNIGAALILGGTDPTGKYLYSIHPSGAVIKSPYLTMGSGSLAATSILETYYKKDMDEKSAISLVKKAVQSGIINDMGSGSNVDIVVISTETKILRNYRKILDTEKKSKTYVPPRGITILTKETIHPIENFTSSQSQHIPMIIDM